MRGIAPQVNSPASPSGNSRGVVTYVKFLEIDISTSKFVYIEQTLKCNTCARGDGLMLQCTHMHRGVIMSKLKSLSIFLSISFIIAMILNLDTLYP